MPRLFPLLLLLFVATRAFAVGDLSPLPDNLPENLPENIDSTKEINEPEPLPELPKHQRIDRRKPSSVVDEAESEPDDPARKELAPETPLEREQKDREVRAQKRREGQQESEDEARERRKKYTSSNDFGVDVTYSYYALKNYDYATNVLNENKGHLVSFSFEWMPTVSYGKPFIGASVGYYIVPDKSLPSSLGAAGLNVFPLGVFVGYRFDYLYHQILVPYGRLGYTMHLVSQSSKDGTLPRDGTQWGKTTDVSFGVALNLFWLDPQGANQMDSDYSVNETFFFFEYFIANSSAGQAPDVGYREFRGGLRLEF